MSRKVDLSEFTAYSSGKTRVWGTQQAMHEKQGFSCFLHRRELTCTRMQAILSRSIQLSTPQG